MSGDDAHARWQTSGFNNRWVFRLSHWGCSLLPVRALYTIGDSLMDWFEGIRPSVVADVEDNLAKAFPDKLRRDIEALASSTLRSYARGVVDYLVTSRRPPQVAGRGGGAGAVSALNGAAILVTAHMGNWEVGGAYLGQAVGRHIMVGFPERDKGVEDFRRERRDGAGHVTLFAGMGIEGLTRLRSALERGERMVVLVDRARGKDSVEVVFRGRPSNFLRSPAVFSFLTGAPIIPVAVMAEAPGVYTAWTGEPFTAASCGQDPGPAMQRIADFFSEILERYPDQWYNFFRYWREGA